MAPMVLPVLQWPALFVATLQGFVTLYPRGCCVYRFGFSEQEVAKGFDTALRSAETKAIKVGLQTAEDV